MLYVLYRLLQQEVRAKRKSRRWSKTKELRATRKGKKLTQQ